MKSQHTTVHKQYWNRYITRHNEPVEDRYTTFHRLHWTSVAQAMKGKHTAVHSVAQAMMDQWHRLCILGEKKMDKKKKELSAMFIDIKNFSRKPKLSARSVRFKVM